MANAILADTLTVGGAAERRPRKDGSRPPRRPRLQLSARYLEAAGLHEGDTVRVEVRRGVLTLRPQ